MMVFALVAMLSYLIFTTLRIVVSDIDFTIGQKKGFRCRCLAEMGINVAMNPTVKKTDLDLLNMSFDDNYESFSVKIRGEGGRLNINTLLNPSNPDKELLKRLFEAWGMTEEEDRIALIDNLIDWVDPNDEHQEHGMEKDQYEKDYGITGYPFNRYFYSLDELLLVPGFDTIASLKPNWRDYLTIYSQGKLDLNEAPADLLAIVCDTTDTAAQEFVETRWGDDHNEDTKDDKRYSSVEEALALLDVGSGPLANDPEFAERTSQRLTNNDGTTRIESTGTVGDFRRRIIMVVRSRQQPQILTREEIPLF